MLKMVSDISKNYVDELKKSEYIKLTRDISKNLRVRRSFSSNIMLKINKDPNEEYKESVDILLPEQFVFKINEEKKRHLIDTIQVQSDLRRRAINRSTEKLYENKEVIGEQLDHNKTIKYENLDNKNLMNKNNGILINNEKEEDEKDDE